MAEEKRVEADKDGKRVLNNEQFRAVEKVSNRVMQELRHAANGRADFGGDVQAWLKKKEWKLIRMASEF